MIPYIPYIIAYNGFENVINMFYDYIHSIKCNTLLSYSKCIFYYYRKLHEMTRFKCLYITPSRYECDFIWI